MINLYNKDCTNFNNNGIATLTPLECLFKASINEVWSLELEIPYDSERKYKFIDNDLILRITDLDAVSEQSSVSSLPYQLFRIYSFRKDTDRMSITAYPVGLDARFDTYVDSLQLYNMPANTAISSINAISDKYLITTDLSNTASAEYENSNIIEILNGSEGFVQKWGGEICYDNYNIKVLSELGANNGVGIRYGKNIESMYFDLDSSNVITRLYPKSAGGEALNGIELYELSENHYVDASNINDYPIPHIYFVQTPFALTKLNNDGSEEYVQSSALYDNIANYVRGRVASITDTFMQSNQNLSLEYIKEQALLTLQNDGVVGFAERVANIFSNSSHFVSEEFIEFVKKAVIEGFDLYFSNIDASRVWIASGSKYSTGGNDDWLVKNAWALNGSRWCHLDSNGYFDVESPTSDVVDTATWKWYKVKVGNATIRRFGNKKRNSVYCWLHNGMETVNGKWYYFDSSGISYTDQTLFNMIANIYDGIGSDLANNYGTSEEDFYQRLYTQMIDYCQEMYDEGINYPTVNIDIDMVDISKTSEYADFQDLIKIHLGDTVLCYNSKLGITTSERVVGIEYDVLRKFNSRVVIGATSNSVISMLNNIGSDNSPKFIAGEGIEIQNNIISVIPPKVPVKDVKVDGVSVVSGGVANIDIDLDGSGLQWFSETENAFFGIDDRTYFWNDKAYDIDSDTPISLLTERGYWSINVYPQAGQDATKYKAVFCPYEQGSYEYRISTLGDPRVPAQWGLGVLMLMSDDITSLNVHVMQYSHPPAGSTAISAEADISFTEDYPEDVATRLVLHPSGSSQDISIVYWNYCSYEYNDTTIYVLCIYSNYEILSKVTGPPDITKYIKAADLPSNPYESLEAAVNEIIPDYVDTVEKYSGIGRTNNLAFFAGGTDDTGLGAPIKIWTDGTYEGLDKVEDVLVNGTSIVSGGVANVTTEEVLNPGSAIDYFNVTSAVTLDVNLMETVTIETSGIYFDYKNHEWNQGASALLQEYEAEIQSSQGLITSSYKHSSYTDVAEGYELTHYAEEATGISPYGINCSHETIGDENPDTGLTIRGLCQYSILGADGLRVYEYDYENDEEVCALNVLKNDIVLNEATWDGTNDSLKDAFADTLTALSSKQDVLTAGSNITIENNVISATGGGGSGADVEANPSTEATEDLLKLRINNKTYRVNDGDNSVILFDGEWKNQDVLEITPYNATVTDGELVCSGLNAGVVVSDVSGLPSGSTQYQVVIEGYSEEGFQYQAGRCNPTTNLSGIIQSGTNRLWYRNDNVVADKDYKFTFSVSTASQGIFLGGYYNVSTTYYKITRIKLITTSTVERTYD